jgi:hypothetical protein
LLALGAGGAMPWPLSGSAVAGLADGAVVALDGTGDGVAVADLPLPLSLLAAADVVAGRGAVSCSSCGGTVAIAALGCDA